MSEENNIFELNEEQLAKVSGGNTLISKPASSSCSAYKPTKAFANCSYSPRCAACIFCIQENGNSYCKMDYIASPN